MELNLQGQHTYVGVQAIDLQIPHTSTVYICICISLLLLSDAPDCCCPTRPTLSKYAQQILTQV